MSPELKRRGSQSLGTSCAAYLPCCIPRAGLSNSWRGGEDGTGGGEFWSKRHAAFRYPVSRNEDGVRPQRRVCVKATCWLSRTRLDRHAHLQIALSNQHRLLREDARHRALPGCRRDRRQLGVGQVAGGVDARNAGLATLVDLKYDAEGCIDRSKAKGFVHAARPRGL